MRIGRILILLALTASCAVKPDCSLQCIGEGFAATTVNTCVFRGASVTSDGYYRAAAFYDADSYVNIAFQKQGSDNWDVTRTQYKGHTADAHNVISIALDGEGFLHMAFDMHSAPLKYCRSLEPYSAVMGELQPMTGTGEADVTYPEFHRLSNGGLLFFYRDGESGRGNLVLNRYNLQQQQWQRVQDVLIDGEGRRNAYPQMYVDSKDGIHLSWVWRETWDVSTNHDMCYAYSPDAGVSWQRTDGTSYELPITLSTAEYACRIPQESDLMNQTSMTADASGHPYIASYWTSDDTGIPQYRLIWHDGRKWNQDTVGQLSQPFSLAGGGTKKVPIARPQLAVTKEGVYYFFRAEEFGSKVSAFHTGKLSSGKWELLELTDYPVGEWEPSLDYEALKRGEGITLFVQNAGQGDGEQLSDCPPQNVYVMDIR